MTIALNRRIAVTAVVATALAGAGLSAALADRGETRTPEWFAPIAEYYDHNPAITPETDFAELHFGAVD